jgi:hypothetical protein
MASGYEAAVTGHRHHQLPMLPSGPWETDDHGGHTSGDALFQDLCSPDEPPMSLWGDEPLLMAAPQSRADLHVHGLLEDSHHPALPLPTAAPALAPQSSGPSQGVTWRCLTCPAQSGCTRCVGGGVD